MIRDRWYAVCEAAQVSPKAPLQLRRLGRDVVRWRAGSGRVVGAPDRCPHTGARLSPGRVVGGTLTCPYHGFAFDGGGRCTKIPVHPDRPIPQAMCLEMLPLAEAHGLIWLWHGTADAADPATIPWFDGHAWPDPHAASGALEYPVHYSRMIESNFDVYHFPYVHRALDPGLGSEVVDLEVAVADGGAAIQTRGFMRSARGKRTAFSVDFLAPNLQRLRFAGVDGVILATPIDAERTWVWARYRQGWTTLWPVSKWLSALLLQIEWRVVQGRQDIPVLSGLTPREAEPGACVWVGADAGAARYVQWYNRQRRAQEQGEGEGAASALLSAGA